MLELIRGAPVIALVLAIVTTIGGAGGAWVARGWIYDTFERPALVEATKQAQLQLCKADVDAAAARATQQAQDKYFQIGEALWRQETRKAADDAAEHEARISMIREEAMDYVGQRQDEDGGWKACTPDDRDRDHIERVWFGADRAAAGGYPGRGR